MAGDAAIFLGEEPAFQLGSVRVDAPRRLVHGVDGVARLVPPRVMQLLVALSQARGEVVSRTHLVQRCWEGRHVGGDAIERAVAQLRRVAGESGAAFSIEAVPRVGYRLIVVEAADPVVEPAPPAPERRVSRRALVLGGGAALLGGAAWLTLGSRADDDGAVAAGPVRLAVMPFETADRDPQAIAYAAGLASTLRDQLSRVAGLRVAAEPSSRLIGARDVSGSEAASQLGVAFLVRGTVRESGGQLRVGVELIDTRAGTIAWAATREGDARAVFQVQDTITGAVLRELVGRIGAERLGALPPPPQQDNGAYRSVVEARQWLNDSRAARMDGKEPRGLDAADRAEALARRALAIDPRAVGALLVMAELERNGWSRRLAALPLTPDQRVEASVGLVTRALAADPNDPAALTALGDYYRRFAWRWQEAETLFRKALSINPSLVEAHWSYAYLLGVVGRSSEGLAHASALVALDPASLYRRLALPRLLYLAGDRAGAMQRYDAERERAPANLFLLRELYLIALSEGDARAMRALHARVGAASPGMPPPLKTLHARMAAAAEALAGQPAALLALIDADVAAYDAPAAIGIASRQGRASIDYLYINALEYAWAGARDRAFPLLERALAGRSLYWPATLPYGIAPFPPETRSDPRWTALWNSDPQRRDLVARRRTTLAAGLSAGWDDSGRLRRVAAADLARSLAYA